MPNLPQMIRGLYILGLKDAKNRKAGCVVAALAQVETSPEIFVVSTRKNSYTSQNLSFDSPLTISVLSQKCSHKLLQTFGFCSGADVNKWDNTEHEDFHGLPVLTKQDAVGYMYGKIIGRMEYRTHYIWFMQVTDSVILNHDRALSVKYYQEEMEEIIKLSLASGEDTDVALVLPGENDDKLMNSATEESQLVPSLNENELEITSIAPTEENSDVALDLQGALQPDEELSPADLDLTNEFELADLTDDEGSESENEDSDNGEELKNALNRAVEKLKLPTVGENSSSQDSNQLQEPAPLTQQEKEFQRAMSQLSASNQPSGSANDPIEDIPDQDSGSKVKQLNTPPSFNFTIKEEDEQSEPELNDALDLTIHDGNKTNSNIDFDNDLIQSLSGGETAEAEVEAGSDPASHELGDADNKVQTKLTIPGAQTIGASDIQKNQNQEPAKTAQDTDSVSSMLDDFFNTSVEDRDDKDESTLADQNEKSNDFSFDKILQDKMGNQSISDNSVNPISRSSIAATAPKVVCPPASVLFFRSIYLCPICGYEHHGKLPGNFSCPICGFSGTEFEVKE